MGGRSGWRVYAGDPTSVVGWMVASVVEEFARVMLWTVATVIVSLVCIALALLFGVFDIFNVGILGSFPPRKRRAPGTLAYLAPIPARDPWYPVRVKLSFDGVVTGFDDGIATLGEGWLHVEGRRTMFSLPAADLARAEKGDGCRVDFGAQTLEVRPYDRIGGSRDLVSEFDLAFRNNLRLAQDPSVFRTLPPLETHPWAFGRSWAAVVLGGFLVALSVPLFMLSWAITPYFGFGVAVCGVWRAGRAGYDLVRLCRYSVL